MSNKAKDLLKERGLRYEDVAAEIGITLQAVSEIVNGRTKGATARYSFAKALGLEPSDIWQDEAA